MAVIYKERAGMFDFWSESISLTDEGVSCSRMWGVINLPNIQYSEIDAVELVKWQWLMGGPKDSYYRTSFEHKDMVLIYLKTGTKIYLKMNDNQKAYDIIRSRISADVR